MAKEKTYGTPTETSSKSSSGWYISQTAKVFKWTELKFSVTWNVPCKMEIKLKIMEFHILTLAMIQCRARLMKPRPLLRLPKDRLWLTREVIQKNQSKLMIFSQNFHFSAVNQVQRRPTFQAQNQSTRRSSRPKISGQSKKSNRQKIKRPNTRQKNWQRTLH